MSVDSAFKTALKRSRINENGHLSPHDLRDVFRTEATIQGVDYDAREFAIGHTVDPRGYDKCYSDLNWLWKELTKIYKRQSTEELKGMAQENRDLQERINRLEGRFETILKGKLAGVS